MHPDRLPAPSGGRLVRCWLVVATLGVAIAPASLHAQLASPAPSIAVPAGRPTPVLLDGRLSPGEWDDARAIPLTDSIRLLLKQVDGHVFLAIATGSRVPRVVDLFLADGSGQVHQLHASAQIGERALPDTLWEDMQPAWRWGNHVDWIANEAKVDATQPADRPFAARLFPADGTEFQIRRSRFSGTRWRLRVEVRTFAGDAIADVLPRLATRDPATWAVLELE